jgi:hypothetical protein
MSKIHDRACGRCGRAMVRPTAEEIEQVFKSLSRSECPYPDSAWVNGYLFEKQNDGSPVVKKIRCTNHVDDQADPRHEIHRGAVWS